VKESSLTKPFNRRAFTAILAGITGFILPISGLILHGYSEGRFIAGRHAWFEIHVFAGIIFVVFAGWHAILNRRPLWNYLKSSASRSWLPSREAGWAALLLIGIIVLALLHDQ